MLLIVLRFADTCKLSVPEIDKQLIKDYRIHSPFLGLFLVITLVT